MALSSIGSDLSGSLQSLLTNTGSGTGSTDAATSIGAELLAAETQNANGSGNSVSPSTILSLSNGLNSSSGTTYNAQGLLNLIQSSTNNDPMLQPTGASAGTDALSYATGTSAADVSNNWATLLKQNPALAGEYTQLESNQTLLNLLA